MKSAWDRLKAHILSQQVVNEQICRDDGRNKTKNTLGQRQAVSVSLAHYLLPVIPQDFNSSFSSETLHPPREIFSP